ncbi:MAG: AMP nucleosidase, partial [Micavibrio aeruginosavorus]
MLHLLKSFKTRSFKNADDAFNAIEEIYNANVSGLREAFRQFAAGTLKEKSAKAYYPFIRIKTETSGRPDTRLSYGFVPRSGVYETTVTRPDIFDVYYKTMLTHLLKNHGGTVEVGVSNTAIPLHFALGEDFHLERDLTHAQMEALPFIFDQPDLALMDDQIANGTYIVKPGEAYPLALFTAPRV